MNPGVASLFEKVVAASPREIWTDEALFNVGKFCQT